MIDPDSLEDMEPATKGDYCYFWIVMAVCASVWAGLIWWLW